MVELRGHHLLCLQFFRGGGYDREFLHNLRKVLDKVEEGIVVVEGGDEVCSSCPRFKSTCEEERVERKDRLALSLLQAEQGDTLHWAEIGKTLPSIFQHWKEKACPGCQWLEVCRGTAKWRTLDEV